MENPVVREVTKDEILRELTEKAVALWGQDRAEALKASLEQTATHLFEVGQAHPDTDIEPGFYQ